MKKIILILSILFLISSCDFDQSFEKDGEIDKDDINIIDKIGNQSIDKAINMYNTRTYAS